MSQPPTVTVTVTNKHGQILGRKGLESRGRILAAARTLLQHGPIAKMTPSKIARAAHLASQTFYLYFEDVEEVLLILAGEASADTEEVLAAFSRSNESNRGQQGLRDFVQAFYDYWERHRAVLTMRNYYSDNGDQRFLQLRTQSSMPIIQAIAARQKIGGIDDVQALARAVIIFAALDRLAARPLTLGVYEPALLENEDLMRAEADILALMLAQPGR